MEAIDARQFIIAILNGEQYGIEIKYIDNIIVMQSVTRVPKAQPYFRGVINLRGEIVPVMSLSSKLGVPEKDLTSKARIIIVRPEQQSSPVGFIVEEVKEVITLENDAIEKMNYDEKDNRANYSVGIGKYGSELINLLSIPAVVLDKE